MLFRSFVTLILLVCPVLGLAQQLPAGNPPAAPTQDSQDLLKQRHQQLVVWLDEYKAWEAWMLKWGNRVAYNAAGGVIKKRPVRPEPPDWLWADCAAVIAAEGALEEACRVLERWEGLAQLILERRDVGGVLTPTDVERKSSFLQRVHLTGGWVPAQLPAPKIYLAVGMQVGVVEIGRVTLPAVGVGLMAMADGEGGYDWKPATVVGIGYRLVSFPLAKRQASLHLNVARVTIHGLRSVPIAVDPSQNFIGFSLTFKKVQ